ncbi:MAG: agmatine deiminase family protein [Deltaproteobacteria bacterium]|nr:agmatine deiminase family protein [Deltaproteobacteria bacterium]
MTARWPAEWERQWGVLLAWPHENSDWAPRLDQARKTFLEIAYHINRFENILVIAPEITSVRNELLVAGCSPERTTFIAVPCNDTWARDFGPITVFEKGKAVLLDFVFNGWGGKFPACLDNQITGQLFEQGCFPDANLEAADLVLEGGSIETDGQGTLLTTSKCLLNPNRNPDLNRKKIESKLSSFLGIKRFLWLHEGFLAGDDTDAHVDILARFCNENTIAYTACDDRKDTHYQPLKRMEKELKDFRKQDGEPYRLIPLPMPGAQYDEKGERLAATYANFLIINEAVLAPIYEDENDQKALARLAEAFTGREIIGIDCRELIRQGGSLHCMTMQLPAGLIE